jgi:hypothetical protein
MTQSNIYFFVFDPKDTSKIKYEPDMTITIGELCCWKSLLLWTRVKQTLNIYHADTDYSSFLLLFFWDHLPCLYPYRNLLSLDAPYLIPGLANSFALWVLLLDAQDNSCNVKINTFLKYVFVNPRRG